MELFYTYFFAVARWLIAIMSVAFIVAWIRYFKGTKPTPKVFAELTTIDGVSIPITSKENILGRGKNADISIPLEDFSKHHAMIFVENCSWRIAPIKGKVLVNLQNVKRAAPLEYGDKITMSGQTLTFKRKANNDISSKTKASGASALLILTVFQILIGLSICLRFWDTLETAIPLSFFALIAAEWCYFLIGKLIKNFTILTELLVFYLYTLGLAVGSTTLPEELIKQMLCYAVGFVGFLILTLILKFKEFIIKIQPLIIILSVSLLYFTAIFGTEVNSSRNWLRIGTFSFQPSELVKVAFVLCGAISLNILISKPAKRWEFLAYSLLCMGALAIMLDFGAVAIFFIGMMIILALRLEKPVMLGSIAGAAVVGAVGVIAVYPYIARRFSAWLHAWEYANTTGYQQSRTMMSFASGGLLGVGGGNGHLHEIPAAENDLVFGIIGEEWGWIVALTAALCLIFLGIYAYRLMKNADSTFDLIATGAAFVMIIFQSALNIFGSVDLLPLTGVTFVFVSRGGTSLISAWLMMSFFKSAELHHKEPTQWRNVE